MSYAYVYVVGSTVGPKKIGIAKNPRARLSQHRTSSPLRLECHFLAQCDASAARDVERSAHRLLARSRLWGEWFDVSTEEAVAAVQAAAVQIDVTLSVAELTDGRLRAGRPQPSRETVELATKLTARQSKAARAFLDMGQPELAKRAGVGPRTLADFESGARPGSLNTRMAIALALQAAGVDLMDREGVALRKELEAA